MTLPFARDCDAQVVDPVTAAQAPVPGVGHHYIGMGSETVNPADGSVNFDLPIQTPAGRGLSFPFGIHYAEAEPFYLTNGGSGPMFGWTTPAGNAQLSPFDLNGWSYQLPNYQAQAFLANSQPESSGCNYPNCSYNYCWGTQNYNFSGFDGHKHTLAAAYLWVGQNSAQPQLTTVCQTSSYSGLNGGVSFGGDNGVATGPFGTVPSSDAVGTQPPFSVTERSGTVYQFPLGPFMGNTMSGVQPFGMLAQTITDRNGNQIVLNGTSAAVGGDNASGPGILPAGSYTDTLGRPILSWTGLGGTLTGQERTWSDQLNIYGVGQINVNWTTTTVTFPDQPQNSKCLQALTGSGVSTASNACGFGSASQSIPMTVVSAIILPNVQQYSFTYGNANDASNDWGRLTKITFPDGGYVRYVWGTNPQAKATFQTWPLDVTIPYAQGNGSIWAIIDTPAITDRYVSYDGTTEVLHQHFVYNTDWTLNPNSGSFGYWTSKSTTVTSYDLVRSPTTASAVTIYTYSPIGVFQGPNDGQHQPEGSNPTGWQAPEVPVEISVVYQDGNNNTLEAVNKTWADQYGMIGDQTILNNGQGMTTLRCLDSYDRVLAAYEYNFQSAGPKPTDPSNCTPPQGASAPSVGLTTSAIGPLMRQTITAYHSFGGTNILDEPDSVTVYDGSGNKVKQTTYLYDGAATLPSGAQTGLVSPPGLRGNATSVSRWLNTSNSLLTTTYKYYDTGQVQSMTDPCGNNGCSSDMVGTNHKTTYSYADSFASGAGSPTGQTNAYLTTVTNPLGQTRSFTWGYSNGLLMSSTDANKQTTNYQYNDPLLRLKEVQGPPDPNNNNQRPTTTYNYTDWLPGEFVPATSSIATSELENTSGVQITSSSILDGMGHVTDAQTTSDPSGMDVVHTRYDGLGRSYQVWNPTRCNPPTTNCGETTWGYTTYNYDALGRKTSQIDSDGVSTQTWLYNGSTVTYTDENNNQWQRTTDALGRLAQVVEPGSLVTNYFYDTLDNLLKVNQLGNASNGDTARTRTFNYDSLSRLLCSSNPENSTAACPAAGTGAFVTGTTGYAYDSNGNVQAKTDARNITTSYLYDALNRVLGKTFSSDPASTPASCYQYDLSSVANGIGRLANAWTQKASLGTCASAPPANGYLTRRSILAYDPMGRILNEQQYTLASQVSGTFYAPVYTYDLAGNLTSSTDGVAPNPPQAAQSSPCASSPTPGATLTFTNCFDAAGRLQGVTSNWIDPAHPQALFAAPPNSSQPSYASFGGLLSATFGNGVTLSRTYDNRLRITVEKDTGSAVGSPTSGSATVTITGAEQSK
jgi:YD repeat-containing protein